MKKQIKFTLSAVMTLMVVSVFGQTDFQPGYIITNNADTVYGMLDNRGHLRNGKVCTFKESEQGEIVAYYPGDIKGYRFDPGKYYVSKWIRLDSEDEHRHVFAEYLVNGIADLYYYRSDGRDHYLLADREGRLVELRNDAISLEKDGVEYVKSSNRHVGLLTATFADCPEIIPSVQKAELSHKSLIDLTSKYHDYVCDGEVCIIYEKELPKFLAGIAPVINLGISSVNFETYDLLEEMDFDKSFSRGLGIQLNLSSPKFNDKISALIEVSLTKDYYYCFQTYGSSGYIQYQDVHLHTSFLESSLGFKYTYPKGRLNPTMAIGGTYRYLVKYEWTYLEELETYDVVYTSIQYDLPINEFYWGLYAQPGINYQWNDKLYLFANLRYQYSSGIDDPDVIKTSFQSLSLVLGINF